MSKEKIQITGRILRIIPVSVYSGKVYTQDVIVELENGTQFAIFDPTKIMKESYLGEKKNLLISISIARSFKKTDNKKIKFLPVSTNPENYQGTIADISGLVNDIIKPPESEDLNELPIGIIDVGFGTLSLIIHKEFQNKIKKGDFIQVDGARLDLKQLGQNPND
jgi:hypothetical protein